MNKNLKKLLVINNSILIVFLAVACSQQPKSFEPAKPRIDSTPNVVLTPNVVSTPKPLSTTEPTPIATSDLEPVPFIPNHIYIPIVELMASVVPVGILNNGQMDVPTSSDIVGLLSPGIVPGEPGTAIMAGHVDSRTGPAIFYPLKKLKPGDQLFVSNENGQKLGFQVTSVQSYLTAEAPLDQIFGDTDESRLNLITCTGKFNRKLGTHEKRLVVYTRLIN